MTANAPDSAPYASSCFVGERQAVDAPDPGCTASNRRFAWVRLFHRRASTWAGMGPFATVVHGDTRGKSLSVERIRIDRTMVASARVVTSIAKCSPMHERLVEHLGGVFEPGDIVGRQFSIADLGNLGGDPVLYVGMVPQFPQGEVTNTRAGATNFGSGTKRVIGPPASLSSASRVCKTRAAENTCRMGSGFFGTSGSAPTSSPSIVAVMAPRIVPCQADCKPLCLLRSRPRPRTRGQVVAGSNPVGPPKKRAVQHVFYGCEFEMAAA